MTTPISSLAQATTPYNASDLFTIVQGGTTKRTPYSDLEAALGGSGGGGSGGLDGRDVEVLTWDSGTQDLDWDTSPIKRVSLAANITTQTFSNTPADEVFGEMYLRFIHDGTTNNYSIAWDSAIEWVDGEPPDTVDMLESGGEFLVALQIDDGTKIIGVHNLRALINYQTGTTYTVQASDAEKTIRFSQTDPVTVTIEPFGTVAFPKQHAFEGIQWGPGAVTFNAGTGVSFHYEGSEPSSVTTAGQDRGLAFQYQGSDVWLVMGDTA